MAEPRPGRPAPQPASSETLPAQAAREFLSGLKRPCRLLVAYSGGGDSAGLLVALVAAAKADPDISLVAVTVDHRLRPGSTAEAHAAGALCATLSIPHHVLSWLGDKPKTGIQAAAREARYALLGDLAREIGADLIVTAHTCDDQAETMAMRRLRDPGAEGGISEAVLYDRHVWIFRPFLHVRRAAIRAYLARQDIGWVDDPSNENDAFERVRIRKALAGGIGLGFNEGGIECGSFALARKETDIAHLDGPEQAIARFLLANVAIHSALVAAVDLSDYLPGNPAHLAAIRHLAAAMGGRTHLGGRLTGERIAQFLVSPDATRLTAERVVFDRRRRHLYLTRERRSLPELAIEPDGVALWDNRFRIWNDGAAPARVGVGSRPEKEPLLPPALPPKLPPGVRQRALAAEPVVLGGETDKLRIEPVIAQFDRFLPLRMLPVGAALAFLLGLDHFPGLPTR